jgi:hypothetical protein
MNPPTTQETSKDVEPPHVQMRGLEAPTAETRESLLQRVRAARKRLAEPPPGRLPRPR